MDFRTDSAQSHYDAVLAAGDELLIACDFDGVLAPIVSDPETAVIHEDGPDLLVDLAHLVRGLAVITGRPARQVLALGELDSVGDRIGEADLDLHVLGQYGNERWNSHRRRVVSPKPPRGLATFERELPRLLREHGAEDAWLEEKGLALGIHTRRLEDSAETLARLRGPLDELAQRHGLTVEPGKQVLEVRGAGMDKGEAVRTLSAELGTKAHLFIGDDLGDVAAFEAVRELRDEGYPGLLVFSGRDDDERVRSLRELADVSVPGPDGVMAFLATLAEDLRSRR